MESDTERLSMSDVQQASVFEGTGNYIDTQSKGWDSLFSPGTIWRDVSNVDFLRSPSLPSRKKAYKH